VYKDVTVDFSEGKNIFTNYIKEMLLNIKRGSPSHPWVTNLDKK
jgi:hypothetical protein